MTLKVIIDTNFLLLPGNFNIDIFQDIKIEANRGVEFVILENVQKELEDLTKKANLKEKDKLSASIGLQLLKQKNLKIEHSSLNKHTDDVIIDRALEIKDLGIAVAIATIDRDNK